ncbi:hypothetical protein K438DRAFT_1836786 [Mycena galopus ATCC 62051]|nr:hypothetical protein K438DRAFT_1836786 [Mycena galopus ATCC 62051]
MPTGIPTGHGATPVCNAQGDVDSERRLCGGRWVEVTVVLRKVDAATQCARVVSDQIASRSPVCR